MAGKRERRLSGSHAVSAGGAGSGGHTAERERSGGPGFHGPGCPDGSAKAERQAEWRGGASGRRLTRAAREATAGCPPKRDERGVRASAKVPRTGAWRRGTRGAAGSGAGASARALDKAAASRMREVTWDTCFSANRARVATPATSRSLSATSPPFIPAISPADGLAWACASSESGFAGLLGFSGFARRAF